MSLGSYILDPALAYPMVVTEEQAQQLQGPIYGEKYIPFDKILNSFVNDKRFYGNYDVNARSLVYHEIVKSLKQITEMIRWRYPVPVKSGVTYFLPTLAMDSLAWQRLSPITQQFYVPINALNSERFKVGELYAGFQIPPRGKYTPLVNDTTSTTVMVRDKLSKIVPGTARMLVRLRDGSLLEIFELNYNVEVHTEVALFYTELQKVLTLDPDLAKKYAFSHTLDNTMGRPAYRLSSLLGQLLKG